MNLRVNGDVGFQVVASTHEFPEGGAVPTSTVDHTYIRGLGTASVPWACGISHSVNIIEKLRDVGRPVSEPARKCAGAVRGREKANVRRSSAHSPCCRWASATWKGVTHDYVRHGTTTLFATLNVLNGAVLATCKPRHRHQEFLSFLREIDKAVPTKLDVHCIVDNDGSHKHPKVKAWLAARPRWHMHFIPTYSSWLNQVERFFALITGKAIRRGSFGSVKQLIQRIDQFVSHYNENCKPFSWTASADSILAKLHRLCARISGTGH